MRLRLLLATILATTLLASGIAAAEEPTGSLPEARVLAGATLSCSAAAPSWVVGCWVERPILTLGPVELALGLDGQATVAGSLDDAHLAPYGILAYYGDTTSVWLELRLPELAGVPVFGSPDWLRVGFTYRIPP